MSKGSQRRVEDFRKVQNRWDKIDWKKKSTHVSTLEGLRKAAKEFS